MRVVVHVKLYEKATNLTAVTYDWYYVSRQFCNRAKSRPRACFSLFKL